MHCRVWSGKKITHIDFLRLKKKKKRHSNVLFRQPIPISLVSKGLALFSEIPLPEYVDPKAGLNIWALVFNLFCTKHLEQAAVLSMLLHKGIEWKSDWLPS